MFKTNKKKTEMSLSNFPFATVRWPGNTKWFNFAIGITQSLKFKKGYQVLSIVGYNVQLEKLFQT